MTYDDFLRANVRYTGDDRIEPIPEDIDEPGFTESTDDVSNLESTDDLGKEY